VGKKEITEFAKDGIDRILLVPMFPQYASGTVGTCLASAYEQAAKMQFTPFLSVVPPFFAEESFLGAVRENIAQVIGPKGSNVDHMLFSFHGLPVDQCTAAHRDGLACDCQVDGQLTEGNSNCYRAQCHDTARRLAADLGLEDGAWSVGFQSRLTLRGTIQWITPYTDVLFEELAARGVRRLAIAAPSFTADCIETLEELGMTGQEEFREAGGEELLVIPCVNSSERWASGLADLVRRQALTVPQATPDTLATEPCGELLVADVRTQSEPA
jgi:ferrochelatase